MEYVNIQNIAYLNYIQIVSMHYNKIHIDLHKNTKIIQHQEHLIQITKVMYCIFYLCKYFFSKNSQQFLFLNYIQHKIQLNKNQQHED